MGKFLANSGAGETAQAYGKGTAAASQRNSAAPGEAPGCLASSLPPRSPSCFAPRAPSPRSQARAGERGEGATEIALPASPPPMNPSLATSLFAQTDRELWLLTARAEARRGG